MKFNEGFDSNHHGIYMDISDRIYKEKDNTINIVRKREVGTNSTNEEGTRYIRHIYNQLYSNNIFDKAEK
jgi:hypothetical protein